jgi:PhzF family phenazine biosynthesis protein
MTIKIFQIDTFTNTLFKGNPAAVCYLDQWLDDVLLQQIASENNLAETAFFIKKSNNKFDLRWFTPEFEMDLCGHATIATAYVIFEELGFLEKKIIFTTHSGELIVEKKNDVYELDFPSRPPIKSELPEIISKGLNLQPIEIWKARDYLLVYNNEEEIRKIEPNITLLNQINIDPGGIIVTARGKDERIDFVSRLFTPQASVFEDPVTGSAHCTLIPFWAQRLNKTNMKALQLSKRGGELDCILTKGRVKISGKAVKYLQGEIVFN